jgi:hypothetical protein
LHFAYVLGHRQDGARLSASINTQKASVAAVAAEVVARNPAAAADEDDDGLAVEWLMRNVGVDPEDASVTGVDSIQACHYFALYYHVTQTVSMPVIYRHILATEERHRRTQMAQIARHLLPMDGRCFFFHTQSRASGGFATPALIESNLILDVAGLKAAEAALSMAGTRGTSLSPLFLGTTRPAKSTRDQTVPEGVQSSAQRDPVTQGGRWPGMALGSLNWSEKGIVVLPESIGDLTVDGHLSLPSDAATTTMPSNSRTFEHSPFRLIVDIAANELLTTVLDLSEKEDALAVSLACEPFHKIISTRYNNTGGVKTPVKGVVSSKARFSWVCNFPQSQQPKWLVLKKEKTADYIASGRSM